MVFADLWSGVRKAKKRGTVRSSYGYKRTIDKIARYYNTMLALSAIDSMQMAGVWYLDKYYTYNIPLLPVITLIGAIGIGLIELKSIFEKAEDKVEFESVARLAGRVITNKDLGEVAKLIMEYMNEHNKCKEEQNKNKDENN